MSDAPKPQPCHHCGHSFAGSLCALCATERPAYTMLKRLTKAMRKGVEPLRDPRACRYFPKSLCGCEGRADCLEAA